MPPSPETIKVLVARRRTIEAVARELEARPPRVTRPTSIDEHLRAIVARLTGRVLPSATIQAQISANAAPWREAQKQLPIVYAVFGVGVLLAAILAVVTNGKYAWMPLAAAGPVALFLWFSWAAKTQSLPSTSMITDEGLARCHAAAALLTSTSACPVDVRPALESGLANWLSFLLTLEGVAPPAYSIIDARSFAALGAWLAYAWAGEAAPPEVEGWAVTTLDSYVAGYLRISQGRVMGDYSKFTAEKLMPAIVGVALICAMGGDDGVRELVERGLPPEGSYR